MPSFHHLQHHIHRYGLKNKPLYLLSSVILFYALFDGVITYTTPLLLTEAGFSQSMMGFIIGTSSITGMIFDFIICRIFKNANFRKIFLAVFVLCSLYPLVLGSANSIWAFLLAMGIWGIYFDLGNFGSLNFLSKYVKPKEHISSAGVFQVFKSCASILAPLFAGLAIGTQVGWKPFILAWLFLGIAFVFFLALLFVSKNQKEIVSHTALSSSRPLRMSLLKELHLWIMTITMLRPLLLLMVLVTIYGSFFWTIGPLFAQEFTGLEGFEGLFITAYELPFVISGWFVGSLALKMGKERAALFAFLIGSILMATISLTHQPAIILALIFSSSFFISFCIPTLNGVYANYISEAPAIEKEIEGVNDMSFNMGYIIGPMLAGFLAENFGYAQAFSTIAIIGTICGLLLIKTVSQKVPLKNLYDYASSIEP